MRIFKVAVTYVTSFVPETLLNFVLATHMAIILHTPTHTMQHPQILYLKNKNTLFHCLASLLPQMAYLVMDYYHIDHRLHSPHTTQ